MLYQAYQAQADLFGPVQALAYVGAQGARLLPGWASGVVLRNWSAACALLAQGRLTHERPGFGITSVRVGNQDVPVREEAALETPFCTLVRFNKAVAPAQQPRVLLIAPMSGHFSTLLRGTVKTMLPEHDVYITDWHNARNVPVWHGPFGVADFVDHLIRFLEVIGPGAHTVAVCQPSVALLAAVALMAQSGHPAQPHSMTLMAGPIDTRVSPTQVNELAQQHPIDWFERRLIGQVPLRYSGALRRVYPGFVQLLSFMSMNLDRHVKAHRDLHRHLVDGETAQAAAIREFYDEYFAVMDLPADFYLETVSAVFQEHLLPLGKFSVRGTRVEPQAIRRTALLTVEGEKDDICAVGQTLAAHELCSGIRPFRKRHYVQPGVGHYGVFNGRRWTSQIYPLLRNFILAND